MTKQVDSESLSEALDRLEREDPDVARAAAWSLYGWAEELTADLPPFTPDEAAQVGAVAARLDARTSNADDAAALREFTA